LRPTVRRIRKGPEPSCLAGRRREARRIQRETGRPLTSEDWELVKDCAQPIRNALVAEQCGLCAYCNNRIAARGYLADQAQLGGMKIEHFVTRSAEPQRMFDWENLLGVCGGRHQWNGEIVETCDAARTDRTLHVHPARLAPDPEAVFIVGIGHNRDTLGVVEPVGAQAASDCAVLNLNAAPLVEARAQVVRMLRQWLKNDDSNARLLSLYRSATTPGPTGLPPHAPVMARYIARKIERRGIVP